MKSRSYSLLVLLLILFLSIVISCSNSTGPEEDHSFPAAIDSVATNITLYVYFAIWINPHDSSIARFSAYDTLEMDMEDTITMDYIFLFVGSCSYFIYAKADGFYTELYYCSNGGTITIDLDAVPDVPNSVAGVIFHTQDYAFDRYVPYGYGSDCYVAKTDIVLTIPDGNSISGTTDSLGRYGFSNLNECEYFLHFARPGSSNSFDITNTAGTDYKDIAHGRRPEKSAVQKF